MRVKGFLVRFSVAKSPTKQAAKPKGAGAAAGKGKASKKPSVPETLAKRRKLNTERRARAQKLRLLALQVCGANRRSLVILWLTPLRGII